MITNFRAALLLALGLVACLPSWAQDPRVPPEYPTIQSVINAASPDAEIKISAGRYRENPDIQKAVAICTVSSKRAWTGA